MIQSIRMNGETDRSRSSFFLANTYEGDSPLKLRSGSDPGDSSSPERLLLPASGSVVSLHPSLFLLFSAPAVLLNSELYYPYHQTQEKGFVDRESDSTFGVCIGVSSCSNAATPDAVG